MPSAPFLAREFNGETLLQELRRLEDAEVKPAHLFECVLALRPLARADAKTATAGMQKISSGRFQPLANILSGWVAKVRADDDVPMLIGHFERLALACALSGAARRGNERLQARGAKP
jgi:hypothetical protein